MDGGQTIELYGYAITADLWGPPGATMIPGQNVPGFETPLFDDNVIDSLSGMSINATEEAIDNKEVTFTRHLFIPANTRPSIAVPQYARSVSVSLSQSLNANVGNWDLFLGPLATGLAIGTLEFTGVGFNLRQEPAPLGDATFIIPDTQGTERFATIIWTIKP